MSEETPSQPEEISPKPLREGILSNPILEKTAELKISEKATNQQASYEPELDALGERKRYLVRDIETGEILQYEDTEALKKSAQDTDSKRRQIKVLQDSAQSHEKPLPEEAREKRNVLSPKERAKVNADEDSTKGHYGDRPIPIELEHMVDGDKGKGSSTSH